MSRRIWLCADDYGISPGVNRAIRDLIENGRLNATSAMVVGPAIGRDEVNALTAAAKANPRCAIGLHVTLTAPFRPLTMHFRPIEGGLFLPHTKLLRRGLMGRLDSELIHTEVTVQLAAFVDLFGRPPDFVDGHQHVQLFPGVRDGFPGGCKDRSARGVDPPMRPRSAVGSAPGSAEGVGSRCLECAVPQARRSRQPSPSTRPLPAPMIFRRQPSSAP